MFFTDSTVAVELLIVFGQLPWLFLHESFHVLAGRRLGLSSRLGLGTRLYFVVFETRMPSLLSVERRRRHLPFLAGMLADVLIVASLGVLASATGGIVRGLALAMAFPVCTRFAYQFLLFLQTDVYFALATALGCYDLHAATKARIANRYWRGAPAARPRPLDGALDRARPPRGELVRAVLRGRDRRAAGRLGVRAAAGRRADCSGSSPTRSAAAPAIRASGTRRCS